VADAWTVLDRLTWVFLGVAPVLFVVRQVVLSPGFSLWLFRSCRWTAHLLHGSSRWLGTGLSPFSDQEVPRHGTDR
jgi:hypothetical protein